MINETTVMDMLHSIRCCIFKNLQQQDMSFFDRNRAGDLMTRMTGDLDICLLYTSRAAVPGAFAGDILSGSVHGIFRVVGGGIVVIIPVLVVNGEEYVQFPTGVLKFLHGAGAASSLAGGEDIGMPLVITVISPSVQVEVSLLEAADLELSLIHISLFWITRTGN